MEKDVLNVQDYDINSILDSPVHSMQSAVGFTKRVPAIVSSVLNSLNAICLNAGVLIPMLQLQT